jgi:hypothetical protein
MTASNPSPSDTEIRKSARGAIGGGLLAGGSITIREAAVVLTVTLTVAAADPFNATVLGETAQVDCVGAPVQTKATIWVNPPLGTTEIW